MKSQLIPIANNPGCREQAAEAIAKLRRKGVHCHLEEYSERQGNCIAVVTDDEPAVPDTFSRDRQVTGR